MQHATWAIRTCVVCRSDSQLCEVWLTCCFDVCRLKDSLGLSCYQHVGTGVGHQRSPFNTAVAARTMFSVQRVSACSIVHACVMGHARRSSLPRQRIVATKAVLILLASWPSFSRSRSAVRFSRLSFTFLLYPSHRGRVYQTVSSTL